MNWLQLGGWRDVACCSICDSAARLLPLAACRQVSREDVEHVLQHGLLNWKLSKFGGKPSPVYVLEGPGVPASGSTGEAHAALASSGEAAAGAREASHTPGGAHVGEGSSWMTFSATVEETAWPEAAATAAWAAGSTAAIPPLSAAQPARQLRVPFAANGGSTVALTIIDLNGDET